MDFTVIGSVLAVLLVAIPSVGAYFQRSTRATRRENRRLRIVAQESDLHLFVLERELTRRGVRPPPRPPILQALHGDEAEPGEPAALEPAPPPDDPGPGGGAGDSGDQGGARHRGA